MSKVDRYLCAYNFLYLDWNAARGLTDLRVRVEVDAEHPGGEVKGGDEVGSDDGLSHDPDVLLGGQSHLLGLPQDLMPLLLSGVKYEDSVLCPLHLEKKIFLE